MLGSTGSGSGSVSRIPVILDITHNNGTHELVQADLVRHLSPLTISSILKGLPLTGGLHKFTDKFVYFQSGLSLGKEKIKSNFGAGEMGYMVNSSSICIFINQSQGTSMNPIGNVKENLGALQSIVPGDMITLRRI